MLAIESIAFCISWRSALFQPLDRCLLNPPLGLSLVSLTKVNPTSGFSSVVPHL
ncbi:hypothetical protein SynRS9902_02086 [Synechococcus sp. RS9902]|nr:hypothetical protein SynRS9902_02086 [Synechococcus sp. RS9902]